MYSLYFVLGGLTIGFLRWNSRIYWGHFGVACLMLAAAWVVLLMMPDFWQWLPDAATLPVFLLIFLVPLAVLARGAMLAERRSDLSTEKEIL